MSGLSIAVNAINKNCHGDGVSVKLLREQKMGRGPLMVTGVADVK